MVTAPDTLPPGRYARGENIRVDENKPASRGGHYASAWSGASAPGKVYAASAFRVPGADEMHVLCLEGSSLIVVPGANPRTIDYPTGTTVGSPARLVQAYNKLYLFRGESEDILCWDGSFLSDWVALDQTAYASGYFPVPSTSIATYHKNRMFYATDDDVVYASDVSYIGRLNSDREFFVNRGSSDRIISFVPYSRNSVLVPKGRSWWMLDNLTGDLTSTEVQLLTTSYGLHAPDSVQVVGEQIFFLDRTGVYRIVPRYDERLDPDPTPLSDKIQPLIDRVNWAYADKAQGVYFDQRYYLAVPLDDNEVNSHVLIFNLETNEWESVDSFPTTGHAVDFWIQPIVNGKRELCFVSPTGVIIRYGILFAAGDIDLDSTRTYADVVWESGALAPGPGPRTPQKTTISLGTWNPTLQFHEISGGNTRQIKTRDSNGNYQSSLTFGRTTSWRYNFSGASNNSDSSHGTDGKKDYSVEFDSGFHLGSGVEFERMAECNLSLPLKFSTRGPQLRITCTTGRVEVRSIDFAGLQQAHTQSAWQ